jgi:Domain of unknown function (DUF4157)
MDRLGCFDHRQSANRPPRTSHPAPIASVSRSGGAPTLPAALGNQALQRLVQGALDAGALQHGRLPAADDRLEREADAVAERLVAADSSPAAAAGSSGSGGALPPGLRAAFERHLPYDLGQIRLHTDAGGHATATRLGARAVTIGRDIAFAPGAYQPHSRAGRRLLAHEVAHAAQQGAVRHRPGRGPALSRSPVGIPQRVPGVDARDSWREVVRAFTVDPREPGREQRATEARRRFLALAEGARLINALWSLAHPGGSYPPRFGVTVAFVDQIPAADGEEGSEPTTAEGRCEPDDPAAPHYFVWVKNQQPELPDPFRMGRITVSGIDFSHTDPESEMASTLHHELLHVEFLRAGLGDVWPTGHGSDPGTQTEPLFLRRERAIHDELETFETRIRREAAARRADDQRVRDEKARREAEEVARRHPAAEPARETAPPFLGAQVRADVGAGELGGARFTGVAGADLILGRLTSLRLGVRGVYLTPDHLLAGATAGLRVVGDEGGVGFREAVDRPWFFDLEAGVLAPLTPGEADRLINRIGGIGGIGLGQEFGRSGTRVFWRLGGYMIISDRADAAGNPRVGGGGTLGLGVRFQ